MTTRCAPAATSSEARPSDRQTTARTLRPKKGKVLVTDGPYAETKEQIGGFMLLEARDLDHAEELISEHPGGERRAHDFRDSPHLRHERHLPRE